MIGVMSCHKMYHFYIDYHYMKSIRIRPRKWCYRGSQRTLETHKYQHQIAHNNNKSDDKLFNVEQTPLKSLNWKKKSQKRTIAMEGKRSLAIIIKFVIHVICNTFYSFMCLFPNLVNQYVDYMYLTVSWEHGYLSSLASFSSQELITH